MTGEEGLGEQRSHEIGRQFMERTRYPYLGMSDQQKGLPQPPLEVEAGKTDTVHNLPAPADIEVGAVDLELSYLLWCTQGVKRVEGGYVTLRTVPSAGARHALETYLLVNNVEGLSPGLYRFLATEHKLVEVNLQADIANEIAGACWGQSFVKTSAVTFIWVAVVYRMTWRYGQRGYRYLHLDAGHVCQNLYLAAQSVGGRVCAVAAFSDENMNRLLGVDGEEQFVIYIAAVGVKQ